MIAISGGAGVAAGAISHQDIKSCIVCDECAREYYDLNRIGRS
ncbi:hypothetical protein GCWU000325_02278 [Alloprevotella tannerae ATCC 51259]|uniref:Uncharacterized protein n=1 Tax=Alloprevotella tannerae ATCC 51259 TaxID=626522 RepID=C9LJ66_9BACT|nr:hypothetical protein GCWU000325_02278 [Alloprevotella tannerae ATCC 51259]